MIIKRSERNQVAIPKRLLAQAGLGKEDIFFDIHYAAGCFVLKPMEFSEKIPREALERFKTHMRKADHEDQTFASMADAIAALKRRAHK